MEKRRGSSYPHMPKVAEIFEVEPYGVVTHQSARVCRSMSYREQDIIGKNQRWKCTKNLKNLHYLPR